MVKEGDTVVNEHGAKQAHVNARMDLIPPENLLLLGECLGYGAGRYGEGNWQKIAEKDNLNHALIHILKWLLGDRSEPHLVNAIARTNFALWHAIQNQEQPLYYNHPNLLKDRDEDQGEEEGIIQCADKAEARQMCSDSKYRYRFYSYPKENGGKGFFARY